MKGKSVPRGTAAQTRRRERRAASLRGDAPGVKKAPGVTSEQAADLIAGASGSTNLALSDRDAAWDAGAAKKSLSEGQYGSAHFWKDPEGDPKTLAAYKLPFATAASGTLTAVWKGVTAAAGAVQGARGGVQIPSGDVGAVKARIGSYYSKAAKQYDDDSIKPPWAADSAKGETAAMLLAYAETAGLVADDGLVAGLHDDGALDAYAERLSYWTEQLADMQPEEDTVTNESGLISTAYVRIRPNLDGFREELEETVRSALEGAITATSPEQQITLHLHFDSHFDPDVGNTITADAELADAIPEEHQAGEQMPRRRPTPQPPAAPAAADALAWSAVLAPEGSPTLDGRIFAPNAISWRELPLTLGLMDDTPHADVVTEAKAVGRIDRIWRDGSLIRAEGVFDSNDVGHEAARQVAEGILRGISVDLAVSRSEVTYRRAILDEDGGWIGNEDGETDAPSFLDILFGDDEEPLLYVIWEGTIGAATVCPFQAFDEATIKSEASLVSAASPHVWTLTHNGLFVVTARGEAKKTLVASAASEGLAPVAPPPEWFADPGLEELTALTIDDVGRIYGHAAAWGTCHIGIPGVCTTAPHSEADYAFFHLGEVECSDGERVSVGKVTLDTGHASHKLDGPAAARHYDNTGTVAAHVRVGEDKHGIWVAGALHSELNADKVRLLRGAVLSGDWRQMTEDGGLELVALLAVNVPGFPVPRTRAMVASGRVISLTATGLHLGTDTPPEAFTDADELERFKALSEVAQGSFADLAELAREAPAA